MPPRQPHDYLLLPDEEKDLEPQQGQPEPSRERAKPPPDPRRHRRNLLIAAVVGVLLLIALIGFGYYWWTTLRWFESTDDAYTQADAVVIAPKVPGYVTKLSVTDNQVVKAGETLVQIDPRDYKAALDQALANLEKTRPRSPTRSSISPVTRRSSAPTSR